ncbi:MAG TPA: undecaprenyl-phosphate alpha-N-acetylglucosaminyl 1-phosphate transferase [Prolixibacteraceae bacterium]|jgi:UDP-N-acetylmuramyl pentapeptide phosphotransferase/UDP-N-acetylglucosamine-1-phosphate transferase|nr:undecaprenyl-phosphate alpha-N-acetylglucosaminyl 1-phosphate transferase [Prolixibacteraceae bacterium]
MLEHLNIFISLALSFTIVYFVIPKIIKVSRKIKLYDVPNERSAAKQIVPTLGGIAIFAGFCISTIVSSNNLDIDELKHLIAGVIFMFLIGLKDDIIGLSAKKKLMAQIIVSLYLVIIGGYQITNLHGIFGIQEIGYVTGAIISIVAMVGLINAINLIDGIDGLAGGIGLLISLIYGFWFLNAGDFIYCLASFSLAGSLIAFLLYNVFGNTNKIFMGDTGSLILGTIIAALTIHFNNYYSAIDGVVHGLPALSLGIIIVPVTDTIRIFAIRIAQKRSPFKADMNHIHHNVLKLTGNHLTSSFIIIAVNSLIILCSFLLIDQLGNNLLFILILVTGFLLAGIPALILKWLNFSKSSEGQKDKSIFALSVFTKKPKN